MELRSNDTGMGQQKYSEKNLSPRRSVSLQTPIRTNIESGPPG